MQPDIDDAFVREVIDKLHEIVKRRGGLRGNQMRMLYEELPEAKRVVKEKKLPVLCDVSNGRLKFIADNSSGRIVEGDLIKKGKTKKKKLNLPWTDDANIPERVVKAMVGLVQESEVEEQIEVKRRYFNLGHLTPGRRHQELFQVACKADEVKNKDVRCLILEMQKGTAERNKEKLYESEDHQDRLQVMRDEICPTGFFSLNDIIERLRDLADDLNVTTTDLGRALAGYSNVSTAIDERNRNTLDVTHLPDTDDCDNRRLIAKATVVCSHDDYITGYTCKSRDTGHVVEAQEHARRLDDRSRRGENRLEEDLRKAGYPPNSYKTEEQLTKDGEPEATPDVLFNEPQTIRGKRVKWIDAKNACDIPGVTPERVMEALRRQVEKYVERFGPGAILWTKCGFCKDVLSGVKGVSHFRPNANSHGQPPRERQAGPSRSSVPDERDPPPVGRLGPRQAFAAPGSATAAEAHELIDRLDHEGVQEFGIFNLTGFHEDMAPFYRYVQDRNRQGQTTGGTRASSEADMREQRMRYFSSSGALPPETESNTILAHE